MKRRINCQTRFHYRKREPLKNTKKELIFEQLGLGLSISEISEKFGLHRGYVSNLSRAFGIRIRRSPKKKKREKQCRSIGIELTGDSLERYYIVRLFRLFCLYNNRKWSMSGLVKFGEIINLLGINPKKAKAENLKQEWPRYFGKRPKKRIK